MILVDTSVWIEYFARRSSPAAQMLDDVLDHEKILLGDLVMVEILQGAREGRDLRLIVGALASFEVPTLCSEGLAPKAAENYRTLRRRGITIRGTIDVIIATWCIENGAFLLHNDRDFDAMERELGLHVWR
jgi:predicted nucleic acid-binding protein